MTNQSKTISTSKLEEIALGMTRSTLELEFGRSKTPNEPALQEPPVVELREIGSNRFIKMTIEQALQYPPTIKLRKDLYRKLRKIYEGMGYQIIDRPLD